MNIVDIILVLITTFSALSGFNRGFFASALSLIGWVGSFVATYNIYPYVEPLLIDRIQSTFLVVIIGYGGSLFSFLMLAAVINFFILTSIGGLRNSRIDRYIGILFGIMRGYLLGVVFFLFFLLITAILHGNKLGSEEQIPNFLLKAKSYSILVIGKKKIVESFPHSLQKRIISATAEEEDTLSLKDEVLSAISRLAEYSEENTLAYARQKAATGINKDNTDIAKDTLKILLDHYIEQQNLGKIDLKDKIADNELKQIKELLIK